MTTTFGPYSPVRQAGNLLFVSGQVGINPENSMVPKDIAWQTERTLLNLENALKKEGASLNDVIKTTVFLTNMDNFAAMNEVYEKRFGAPRPARSCVGVGELPHVAGDTELLVEIEAVAARNAHDADAH